METIKTQGKLIFVADAIKECDNANRTKFRTCTVEIKGKEYFAKIWEKSFQNGVVVGTDYTCELQADGDTVWITLLNGSSAAIATMADFADLFAEITV